MPHQKSIILSCIIFFFNNWHPYVMFYTCICCGNTFQYKYTVQLHVVKQSHAWVLFVYSYIISLAISVLSRHCSISRSSPPPAVFNWHEVLSPRVLGSQVSTSCFVYSLKRLMNYCCRICTISCMIFKNRPLFTKYEHCKPLFPFQKNA